MLGVPVLVDVILVDVIVPVLVRVQVLIYVLAVGAELEGDSSCVGMAASTDVFILRSGCEYKCGQYF